MLLQNLRKGRLYATPFLMSLTSFVKLYVQSVRESLLNKLLYFPYSESFVYIGSLRKGESFSRMYVNISHLFIK